METKIQKIMNILSEYDSETQMKIITECVSEIGTKEWQEKINDLIKRIEKIKK